MWKRVAGFHHPLEQVALVAEDFLLLEEVLAAVADALRVAMVEEEAAINLTT